MVLERINAAKSALMEAQTIEEVFDIRNQANAALTMLKSLRDSSFETQNFAAELKVRAERKLGEITRDMPKNKGVTLGGSSVLPPDDTPTYADLGLNKSAVSR